MKQIRKAAITLILAVLPLQLALPIQVLAEPDWFDPRNFDAVTTGAVSATYGERIQLIATVSSPRDECLRGREVAFFLAGRFAGTAMTDQSGVATLPDVGLGATKSGEYESGIQVFLSERGACTAAVDRGMLTIGKALLTVTPADVNREYGTANPPLKGLVDGIRNSETFEITYATDATETSRIGAYTIRVGAVYGPTLSNYNVVRRTGTLTIGGATTAIVWPEPRDIPFGTPLGPEQLNARVLARGQSVPGTFTYDPPAGTVLAVGDKQTLWVTFTPDDPESYPLSSVGTAINVKPAGALAAAQPAGCAGATLGTDGKTDMVAPVDWEALRKTAGSGRVVRIVEPEAFSCMGRAADGVRSVELPMVVPGMGGPNAEGILDFGDVQIQLPNVWRLWTLADKEISPFHSAMRISVEVLQPSFFAAPLDQALERDLRLAGPIVSIRGELIVRNADAPDTVAPLSLKQPLMVRLPFGKADTAAHVRAYGLSEATYTWEYRGGQADPDQHTVAFRLSEFGEFAPMESLRTFADIRNHWAREDIELLAAHDVLGAASDESFAPARSVTRSEFAVWLNRALRRPATTEQMPRIREMRGRSGSPGPSREEERLTREELAVMLVWAAGLNETLRDPAVDRIMLSTYPDHARVSPWARQAMLQCLRLGLLRQSPSGALEPEAYVTRAEAVVILRRLLQVRGEL